MSNYIRKIQKRLRENKYRSGRGTRGQRKGPAKMGMTVPQKPPPPPKPKPAMPGVKAEEAAAAMHEACKAGGATVEEPDAE